MNLWFTMFETEDVVGQLPPAQKTGDVLQVDQVWTQEQMKVAMLC